MSKSTRTSGGGQAPAAPTRATVEPSWWAMVRVEPRLYAVTALAASLRESGGGWSEWEQVKRKLSRLVGWDAENPLLATEAHYDAAYETVLRVFEEGR